MSLPTAVRTAAIVIVGLVLVVFSSDAMGAIDTAAAASTTTTAGPAVTMPAMPNMGDPSSVRSSVQWIVLITVLSVAPAVLVMATCFTRIIIVLGLLRTALATQQLPPNQVLFGLALLMTVVVMAPTYAKLHQDAVAPYLDNRIGAAEALNVAEKHAREFMIQQVESAGNSQDVQLFLSPEQASAAKTWHDVPTLSLLPGYVVSELKVAFMMGFRIFLPFLVIDMLVASVLVSMGMLMVPPVMISLPFKLLLFVLADGWHLVIGTLMTSFR